jgi:hypothetical protein
MVLGLFYFINPLWQFIIGPMALIGLGWWLKTKEHKFFGPVKHQPYLDEQKASHVRLLSDSPKLYDWQDDPDFGVE